MSNGTGSNRTISSIRNTPQITKGIVSLETKLDYRTVKMSTFSGLDKSHPKETLTRRK